MKDINRRNFIKTTGMAAGGITMASVIPGVAGCNSPSDMINVGLIGCRSMGFGNLKAFLAEENVNCIALCDVDRQILDSRAREIEELTKVKPLTFTDFRHLLENPDINTVIIGTPDHWHVIMALMALEAGKHIYIEKPMGHSIEECQVLVEKAKQYPDLKIQVGMWQRSSQHWFDAADMVRSGKIGEVNLVKAWIYKGYDEPLIKVADSEAPDYVDYDMWLGPAPKRPFNKNRFHYNFRWFWDYAGGAMTDWGVHLLDFALHGMDAGYPETISPGGGNFQYEDNVIDTPDIQQAIYNYPDHTMIWECGLIPGIGPFNRGHGVSFTGTRGTLVVNRNGWQVYPEIQQSNGEPWMKRIEPQESKGGMQDHVKNFLKCIRKGGTPNASVEVGALTAIVSEMGNIAYRTGQVLHWDKEFMRFREEAGNKLASLEYSGDWKL
jgi:predicted dehydrogenase